MRRVVIGGRNRVLAAPETYFLSGAAMIADFAAHQVEIEAADVIVWAWFALDARNRPDIDATLRGTEDLLNTFAKHQLPLIFLSTDAVFSGREGQYAETDTPDPQTDYARIKLAQEGLMANFPRLRFTTFGPSHNPTRPLLMEMIAQRSINVDRPRQRFSPISTTSLNRAIDAIARAKAAPRVYHLTSEPITKTDCLAWISQAIGVPLPQPRTIDATPLDLSLTSTTHNFPIAEEIDLAVAEWKRLRA